MDALTAGVQAVIESQTGVGASVVSRSSCGGGCINQAEIFELADGRRFFVKSNSNCGSDFFAKELLGLQAMAATDTVNVPEVVGSGRVTGGVHFLILQAVDSAAPSPDFSEILGRQLARMHRAESGVQRFGFGEDNFLGSSAQPNAWCESWAEFWVQQRLGFQFSLARKNGYGEPSFNDLAERLLSRVSELVSTSEPPALIHGDLWSGNYMVGGDGQPVLIDPAVYYAHREAEFGMTTLFGGFDDRFYAAYQEVWPLPDGSTDRIAIYRLYHLLNHLNLFGSSYRSQCLEIMKRYS